MKVLVAGASGGLGGEICRRLLSADESVVALFRESSDPAKIEGLKSAGAQVVFADLKEPASLKNACRGMDAVVSTISSTLSRREGDTIESVDHKVQLAQFDAHGVAGVQ